MKQQQQIPLSLKLAIVLIWALPQMSTDIYLPSIPSMAHYFATSLDMVQYTIFFYAFGFSIGSLIFGPVSDRIGRRPVILWGLALAAVTTLLALAATSLHILYLARFIQGIALAGVGSTMRAVTKDVCPDKEDMAKFGAVLGIIIPIASSVAPVIGGYVEKYTNWRVSFGFLLIYILIFLVYTIRVFPETNNDKLDRSIKYMVFDYKEVLFNGKFFRYNAVTAFALCSMYAYLTLSPYLLQVKVGLPPEDFGYTNLLISATLIVSSYINSKLISRRGVDNLLYVGVCLLGLSGLLFLLGGVFRIVNLYSVIIPLVILVFGCGLIYPNASAGGLSLFSKSAGTAGAVYAFIQMLGGSVGSGLISFMSHYGDPLSCLGLLVILQGIVGAVFARQLIKQNSLEETASHQQK